MTAADRRSLASVVAALLAGVPLVPLTEDRSYLVLALLLMLASAAIGAALRRVRLAEALIRILQLAPVALLPTIIPETGRPFVLLEKTYSFVQVAFAPMPYQVGFAVFSALIVWVVYLLTETLTIGLASPAWTFPVLVLPYLVPSLALYSETSPFLFCFTAAGFALVLATATATSAADGESDAPAAQGLRRGVAVTAILATVTALTGAILVSLPIPERSGQGSEPGGSGAVQLGDPSVDLIRNVNSNSSQVVITYRTDDGSGEYLRLAALPMFDARGFHLTATDLVPLQIQADPPLAATGVVTTSIEIGNLAGEYLPIPWFPVTADVPTTSWRYDPKTLAIVAVGVGRTSATRNLSYTTTSARLPEVDDLLPALLNAGDPQDDDITLDLPPAVSDDVRNLARQVTRGQVTDGAKAKALLDFLHSDRFSYSTAVTPGTTLSTLDDFLLGSRIGYCEQFAGSMAVLARIVGIPSRVVVGFLPGKKVGEEWQVTPRNMHAWTELYFEGVGWVPVDPTPSGGVNNPNRTASAAPSRSATASAEPTVPSGSATPTAAPDAQTGGGGPTDPLPWLASAGTLLVVGAFGPRATRAGLRRFRLAGTPDPRKAAERAWAEVQAVAVDHGRDWPGGTSRQVAATFGPELDPAGREALRGLARTVERARYDRDDLEARDLAPEVEQVTEAIERRWGRPTARAWWPRSLRLRRPS
ncbi:MAG: hypothetical protein KDB60_08525 [Propionibacteriaceae bacterium]|nr:hypothetical protein [Propionibacteriaceae bacterium]